MVDHPLRVASAATDGIFVDELLEAGVKRLAIVLGSTESLGDIEQATGEIALAVIPAAIGTIFFYDPTDTTTVDDGVTCLVDGSGHRYHLGDSRSVSLSSVLAQQNTPPGSPSVGDGYVVGTSPTGAWAGAATSIAVYTRRGWVFATPEIGMAIYDQSSASNIQFDENGDWVPMATTPADGSIDPAQFQFPAGLSVEAQQNAPPGSVTVGPHYLVGTSGSGAWAGQSNKIAYSRDGASWLFIAPYEGASIYNKGTSLPMRYEGGAWVAVQKGVLDQQSFVIPGAATWTKPSGVGASSMVLIQAWGGGGGGGGGGAGSGGGGGGGAGYVEAWVPASELGATVSVTVGSAGSGGASGANGVAGGNSLFGAILVAYGGGAGSQGSGGTGGGGGGGAGALGKGGNGGVPTAGAAGSGGGAVGGESSGPTGAGNSVEGGGGGGHGATGTGGISRNGGGGGGGGGGGNRGTSLLGGNGGGGGSGVPGTAGDARGGGGGGGGGSQPGGNGGRGEIRVTVFA